MSEQAAFCNTCGFCGKPDRLVFHSRPIDGQICKYAAQARTLETPMTDQDHAKIVRETRVTQADREAAAQRMDKRYGAGHWLAQEFRDGKQDGSDLLAAFARHRLAAEAAAFEKAAGVPLQISGLIGASTGSSIDSALCQASEAIRNLAGERYD